MTAAYGHPAVRARFKRTNPNLGGIAAAVTGTTGAAAATLLANHARRVILDLLGGQRGTSRVQPLEHLGTEKRFTLAFDDDHMLPADHPSPTRPARTHNCAPGHLVSAISYPSSSVTLKLRLEIPASAHASATSIVRPCLLRPSLAMVT